MQVVIGTAVATLAVASIAYALPQGGTFVDDNGHVFEPAIEAVAAEGITKGCNPPANTKFCPDDNVTRGQMAAFLVRALGYTDVGDGNLFTDDDNSVFENAIDKLGTAGVTKGCNPPANTKFCPDDNVTRGQMASFLARALDLFICHDPLGCVSYGDNDSVRVAAALALSGVASDLGQDELRSAELAVQGRDVKGHGVELLPLDSECSSSAAGPVANAIVADDSISAIVGTSCSSAAREMAPIVSDAGYSMVSPSNTLDFLTDPLEHADGYLRVAWNDADQGVAMAQHATGAGAATSAVVVGRSSEFLLSLGEAFEESFAGINLAFLEAAPDGSNAVAVIAAVVAAGPPDVLYLPVFEPAASALVAEARKTPALDATQLATHSSNANDGFVAGLSGDAEGMLFTVPDDSFTTTNEYKAYHDEYVLAYGTEPGQFGPFAYDAANVVLNAINEVAITGDNGTLHVPLQALRDELFGTAGFKGATGTITCDALGECGATGFQILTVVAGNLVPAP